MATPVSGSVKHQSRVALKLLARWIVEADTLLRRPSPAGLSVASSEVQTGPTERRTSRPDERDGDSDLSFEKPTPFVAKARPDRTL